MSAINEHTLIRSTGGGHGPNCPHCQALAAEAVKRREAAERTRANDARLHPSDTVELSPDAEEAEEIRRLKARDREVRAHEQAHLAAAGPYAMGGPSYEMTTGPDGRQYATGGEVPIDISKVPGDPEATLRKAETVRRAAMAPAEPSAADMEIAARASQLAAEARAEMMEARREEKAESKEAESASAPHANHEAFRPAQPAGTSLDLMT